MFAGFIESNDINWVLFVFLRLKKILNKFVDEGILPENWSSAEMPIIAKNLTKAVYEDCIKEENDIVKQINDFGKVANGIAMKIARQILNEKI
mgnify:CR=1 FL=1